MFTCIITVVTYKKDEGREYDLICFNLLTRILIRYTLFIMIMMMMTKMMMIILVTIRMIMICDNVDKNGVSSSS